MLPAPCASQLCLSGSGSLLKPHQAVTCLRSRFSQSVALPGEVLGRVTGSVQDRDVGGAPSRDQPPALRDRTQQGWGPFQGDWGGLMQLLRPRLRSLGTSLPPGFQHESVHSGGLGWQAGSWSRLPEAFKCFSKFFTTAQMGGGGPGLTEASYSSLPGEMDG